MLAHILPDSQSQGMDLQHACDGVSLVAVSYVGSGDGSQCIVLIAIDFAINCGDNGNHPVSWYDSFVR